MAIALRRTNPEMVIILRSADGRVRYSTSCIDRMITVCPLNCRNIAITPTMTRRETVSSNRRPLPKPRQPDERDNTSCNEEYAPGVGMRPIKIASNRAAPVMIPKIRLAGRFAVRVRSF